MLQLRDTRKDRACMREVKKLYFEAFPTAERVPFFILKRKVRKGLAELSGVYDGDDFVGMTCNLFERDIVYLFYLAVAPAKRSGGYGGQILEDLKARCPGKRILISIEELDPEAPDYEMRKRRKGFYQRHGFEDARIKFREYGVVFEMLSWGGGFEAEEYAALIRKFRGEKNFDRYYQKVE